MSEPHNQTGAAKPTKRGKAHDGVAMLNEALRKLGVLRPRFEMRVTEGKGMMAPVPLPRK